MIQKKNKHSKWKICGVKSITAAKSIHYYWKAVLIPHRTTTHFYEHFDPHFYDFFENLNPPRNKGEGSHNDWIIVT